MDTTELILGYYQGEKNSAIVDLTILTLEKK
jgi:hypothetical protein